MAGPGAVSFLFSQKGLILVDAGSDSENTTLLLIDLGVPDFEETDDGIELFIEPGEFAVWREKVTQGGFVVKSAELVYKPKSYITVGNEVTGKVASLIEALDDSDDVQRVFTNIH